MKWAVRLPDSPLFFVVDIKKVLLFEFDGSNYLFALKLKLISYICCYY